tara:strand:- start:11321 stop:12136 length:816 start_codon:yes stop_codon:yes gene_type:complete
MKSKNKNDAVFHNSNSPLISVIIPCFNNEDTLSDAIKSITRQTYQNFEIIIINDNSSDRSIDSIKEILNKDKRVRVIHNRRNMGSGPSRNIGIKSSEGKYICFLDADDLWINTKLEDQLNFMLKNNYDFSYTSFYERNNDKIYVKSIINNVTKLKLLFSNPIPCITVMYEKKKFKNIFQPDLQRAQDFGHWVLMLKNKRKAFGFNKPLSIYSRRKLKLSQKIQVLKSYIFIVKNYYSYGRLIIYFTFPLFLFTNLIKKNQRRTLIRYKIDV